MSEHGPSRDAAWLASPLFFRDADGVHRHTSDAGTFAPLRRGEVNVCSQRVHVRLRGRAVCLGCGRTRNELALDGEL